jgi:hypothetical protein
VGERRVRGLFEGRGHAGGDAPRERPKSGQAARALGQHHRVFECEDPFEHHVIAMSHDLPPVRLIRRLHIRFHQPEIATAVVGADEEAVALVVDLVFVILMPRCDQPEGLARCVSSVPVELRGGVGGGDEEQDLRAAGAEDLEIESLVRLGENEFGLRIGEGFHPVKLRRAFRMVLLGEEEGAGVRGPGHGDRLLERAIPQLAGDEILDLQTVLAEAGVVGGIREERAIVAHQARAQGHERPPRGEIVDVEHGLERSVGRSVLAPTLVNRILAAFLVRTRCKNPRKR